MSEEKRVGNEVSDYVDSIWNNWLDSVKHIYSLHDEIEKESFNTFNQCITLVEHTKSILNKVKKEHSLMTKQSVEQLKRITLAKEDSSQFNDTIIDKVNKMNHDTHQLFWTMQEAVFDFMATSQKKVAHKVESLLENSRQERVKTIEALSEIIDDIKAMQHSK